MKKMIVATSFIFLSAILFFACKKDLSKEGGGNTQPFELTTTVVTSVSGFVTDENDHPVQFASVSAGLKSTTTNQLGFFEIRSVQLIKNAAFVAVEKPGYFKGIKTWVAATGRAGFFRVKLLPMTNAGSVSSSTGGDVTLPGGMKISFPAAAFVNAVSGAVYNGNVSVKAKWLDPTAADLDKTMPGDLRALDANGGLKLLTTYGMAAVELVGSGNEKLQVAPGKKATLTMPIPAAILATAPANIALWYFDETKGLWKEEGSAVKTGNAYIGNVSHFTYWNCDIPGPVVQVTFRLLSSNGTPRSFTNVWIQPTGTTYGPSAHGYTDEQGYATGPVPANAQLDIKVPECNGETIIHSFSTNNADLDLGTITISNNPAITAYVTGTVTDCAGNPLTDARIFYSEYYNYYTFYPATVSSATGQFSFPMTLCNGPLPLAIVAQDNSNGFLSPSASYTIHVGTNALGNFQTCGTTPQEYLDYTYNNVSHHFVIPTQQIFQYGTFTYAAIGSYSSSDFLRMDYEIAGVGAGNAQVMRGISAAGIQDSVILDPGAQVLFTEYGPVGQYITGNFSVNGHKYSNPAIPVNISANFRMKRGF